MNTLIIQPSAGALDAVPAFSWRALSSQLGRELASWTELRDFAKELKDREWEIRSDTFIPTVKAINYDEPTLYPPSDRIDVGVYLGLINLVTDLRANLISCLPAGVQCGLGLVFLGRAEGIDLEASKLLELLLTELEVADSHYNPARFRTKLIAEVSYPLGASFAPYENLLIVRLLVALDGWLKMLGRLSLALR